MIRALIITEDGTATLRDVDGYEGTKAIVDGWLEGITGDPAYGSWWAFVDEDGGMKRRAPNPLATDIMRALGWQGQSVAPALLGPAVFVGADGDQWADVPEDVVRVAREYADILTP